MITLDPRRALVMVRPDISRDQGRQPAGPEQAKIINTHVAFHAHKFIIRRTGTNPLHEIVVPKRAHPIIRVGDLIGMAADASEAARNKMVAGMSSRRSDPSSPEVAGFAARGGKIWPRDSPKILI